MIRKIPINSELEKEEKYAYTMHVTSGNSCAPTKEKKRKRKLAVPTETSHILDGLMLNFMQLWRPTALLTSGPHVDPGV